jgi:hypothetical protein
MNRAFLTLVLSSCLLACGPTLVFPGGALDGKPAPTPSDWTFTDEVSTIQLETRPDDPYSVNIWAVGIDDRLYVHAGANRAAWVERIEADPAVRARIANRIYSLEAVRVDSQAEFDAFADAYETKYGTRPRNENVDEVYLFALGAR